MGNEEKELLPCPFCGVAPDLVKGVFGYQSMHNGEANYKIECRNIECFGPATPLYGNNDDAVAAWNRRASTIQRLSAIEQERDALREAVEELDRLSLVIEAGVRWSDPGNSPHIKKLLDMPAVKAAAERRRAALLHEGQG